MTDRYATGVVAALTLLALICVAYMVPIPYVPMKPGPTFDTLGDFGGKPMFSIKGAKTYPTDGSLDFTTVSLPPSEASFTLFEGAVTLLNQDIAILPREFVYPKEQTPEENQEQGAAQLASSKDRAQVAALRAAGFTVPEKPIVVGITEGAPAEGHFRLDDRILAVDGKRVKTTEEVGARVQDRKVGAKVELTVLRKGREVSQTIATAKGEDGKPRIGIAMRPTFTYPVRITNNVDDSIGGPSAGAMFALAIYDLLTPGALTDGRHVAGTGEITPSGKVGPIGGIQQKIAGAESGGATIFLVPADNCAEAKDVDTDMTLVKATTLAGAIDSLEKLAENPEARVPSCG